FENKTLDTAHSNADRSSERRLRGKHPSGPKGSPVVSSSRALLLHSSLRFPHSFRPDIALASGVPKLVGGAGGVIDDQREEPVSFIAATGGNLLSAGYPRPSSGGRSNCARNRA